MSRHLILVGLTLLAVGLVVGRRLNRRIRLVWIITPILLAGLVAYLALGKREVDQQARVFFGRIETGNNLSDAEADTLRQLARSSPELRRGVLKLAFASTTNAAIALPRLEFLLQACIGLEAVKESRLEFWRRVAQPALKARPSLEILRLAAGSVDFLRLEGSQADEVAKSMLPMLSAETNSATRTLLANELGPLADRMLPAYADALADSLLRQVAQEQNLAQQGSLLTNLAQAIKRLDTNVAQQKISQALTLADAQTNSATTLAIVQILPGLNNLMSADQCRHATERLADAWLESDGRPKPGLAALMPPLARRMPPEASQELALRLVSKLDLRLADLFYLRWAELMTPALSTCSTNMGSRRNAVVVSAWIRKPPEIFADLLWARLMTPLLAQTESADAGPLAEELINKILTSNAQAKNLYSARFGAVAERLDSNQAQDWINLLVPRLLRPDVGDEWEPLISCMSHLSARLDSASANALATRLLPDMKTADVGRVLALSKIIIPIAPKLDSTNAELVVESLLAAMGSRKNVFRVNALAEQLAFFARHVKPDQMEPVINQLVLAMEKQDSPDNARALTSGLGALAAQLDSTQAARVGEGIVRAIEKDPLKYFMQGPAIEKLARRIKPEQAKRAVGSLLERGLSRGGPDTFLVLNCAPRVAGALTPDLAESFVSELTLRFGTKMDLSAICLRLRVAATFTNALPPDRLQFLGDRLMRALDGDTNSVALEPLLSGVAPVHAHKESSPRIFIARDESELELFALRTLCEALSTVLPAMPQNEAEALGGRLAVRFSAQGWIRSVPFDEHIAQALRYASESNLRKILGTPFAVGGLRQNVLRALELKSR